MKSQPPGGPGSLVSSDPGATTKNKASSGTYRERAKVGPLEDLCEKEGSEFIGCKPGRQLSSGGEQIEVLQDTKVGS